MVGSSQCSKAEIGKAESRNLNTLGSERWGERKRCRGCALPPQMFSGLRVQPVECRNLNRLAFCLNSELLFKCGFN